ncbi:hypothetical protein BpHYR1_007169 [Brachionus plicatilis]|uniref:Uncharacterized protein n=1 Tax=Brachionus plicatilis TaxID=10195 RepID=A0A3M7S6E6_BRAPC|nr:hypothetical protein BpHYR1_007169 [Brachionus plicatilis]
MFLNELESITYSGDLITHELKDNEKNGSNAQIPSVFSPQHRIRFVEPLALLRQHLNAMSKSLNSGESTKLSFNFLKNKERNPYDQDRLTKLKSNGTSDLLNISRAQLTHINVWGTELKE